MATKRQATSTCEAAGPAELSPNSFDSLAHSRSRSTRAASLALPNTIIVNFLDEHHQQQHGSQPNQNQLQSHTPSSPFQHFKLAPPSASSINIRRHSSHHCQIIDKVSDEQMRLQTLPVLPPAPSQPVAVNPVAHGSACQRPPPVPKRNFSRTSMHNQQSPNLMFDSLSEASPTVVATASGVTDFRRKQGRQSVLANCETGTARYTSGGPFSMSSDDDLLNMDSPVFIETVHLRHANANANTNPFLVHTVASSQRSSSDSNHTQSDAGYVTTTTPTAKHTSSTTASTEHRIFFGESGDHLFGRGRFSSVDTQSSVDSGCTDVTKCMSPPSSCDTDAPLTTPGGSAAPAVPKRRQQQPKPALGRMPPPVPPARGSGPNSPRVLQNVPSNNAAAYAHELYSKPIRVPGSARRFRHPTRVTQRQDSNLSSDSYSTSYSPGYNSKSMEQPLLPQSHRRPMTAAASAVATAATAMAMSGSRQSRKAGAATGVDAKRGGNGGTMRHASVRQDSTLSSDSVSVTSSPGYNTKLIESPLIAQSTTDKLHTSIITGSGSAKPRSPRIVEQQPLPALPPLSALLSPDVKYTAPPGSPIIKSVSTPASLQTFVRFQRGSNASLHHHHQPEFNRRKSSSPYITHPKLNGRTIQVTLNVCVVIVVFLALFVLISRTPGSAPPNGNDRPAVQPASNNTSVAKVPGAAMNGNYWPIDMNPAPGVCLPVIVKFCESAPYNYTVFPNYIGHFGQLDAEEELEAYDALVDVQCYELVYLFLCSIFAPKCGLTGKAVAPCKALCLETNFRCGFFFDVFGLNLPEYLDCKMLTDSPDSNVCIGWHEVQDARRREAEPPCSAFQCDNRKRCIPLDWRCDGHSDCKDQTDEQDCAQCPDGGIFCGGKFCLKQSLVCDGVVHCPFGQDERNCIRLSGRFGDVGKGTLEVFKPQNLTWLPACVDDWDKQTSPTEVCTLLGYNSVNASRVVMSQNPNLVLSPSRDVVGDIRLGQRSQRNLLHAFNTCTNHTNYQVAELTCSNFECGRVRAKHLRKTSRRIVGGTVAAPGDWPFIAAILGGPREIFYCAGVLIADQWVLTAAHCVGNHTLRNINDFTIQLGITRRHSYSYYGEMVKVRRVIPHPQYNELVIHDNDIALFQLATRVAFHEHILPVCLPPPGMKELHPGMNCTVIGWGKKELRRGSAAYEPTINEVVVPVLNRSECNDWLVQLNVTEGMICAGYAEGGKDACQGDSGGPLMCRDPADRERWFVGGIVSWGVKCAHPKLPGVYANVPRYVPWIQQQMQRYSKY